MTERTKDPDSAESKYSKQFTARTTPHMFAFLKRVQKKTGARNFMDVLNDALKVYHREWKKENPNG